MSEEDLRRFVDDLVSSRIFTDRHVRNPSDIPMVFLPLAFGALSGWSDTGLKGIGVIWEYFDKAGPTSINGYPVFFSMHLMNAADWAVVSEAARRESERRKSIEL